jgi:hypothetical protein
MWHTKSDIAIVNREIDILDSVMASALTEAERLEAEARLTSLEAQLAGLEKLLVWIRQNARADHDDEAVLMATRKNSASLWGRFWSARRMGSPIRL